MNLNGSGATLRSWKSLKNKDSAESMDWSFREKWDEFTWAREIRKDELRIAGYFRTLPSCLDLPEEDEMIFKRLMAQPEMVPTGVSDPVRTLRSEFELSDEEWEEDAEQRRENRRRNNFDAARMIENLAEEWVAFSAFTLPQENTNAILKITCAFGKVLSRIYNFEDTDDAPDTLALRTALLKYILSDLNELAAVLDEFKKEYSFEAAEDFFNTLSVVRESVLDRLKQLRGN